MTKYSVPVVFYSLSPRVIKRGEAFSLSLPVCLDADER